MVTPIKNVKNSGILLFAAVLSCFFVAQPVFADALNIVLNGDNPMTIGYKSVYHEPGATATDGSGNPAVNLAGDASIVGSPVVVNSAARVDTSRLGTYHVYYTASDGVNSAARTDRVVIVADIKGPVIDQYGDMEIQADSLGGATAEYAVTAQDDLDGSVTASCAPASATAFAIGKTTVTCTAQDKAGNEAAPMTFNVMVNPGPIAKITLSADKTNVKVGETVNLTVNAYDQFNNLANGNISISATKGTLGSANLVLASGQASTTLTDSSAETANVTATAGSVNSDKSEITFSAISGGEGGGTGVGGTTVSYGGVANPASLANTAVPQPTPVVVAIAPAPQPAAPVAAPAPVKTTKTVAVATEKVQPKQPEAQGTENAQQPQQPDAQDITPSQAAAGLTAVGSKWPVGVGIFALILIGYILNRFFAGKNNNQ